MRALLDVNVLLALLDADHVDHARAREFLHSEIARGWASCPITENGLVRVISQPSYPRPVSPTMAIERLQRACEAEDHEFWECGLSVLDAAIFDRTQIHGPRQVTDAYLLGLATARGGRFVTFDRGVPLSAVPGAKPDNLVTL